MNHTKAFKKSVAASLATIIGLAFAHDASALLAPGRGDTYVDRAATEKNFGAEKTMRVASDAFSLVRFNLSSTVPAWVCSDEVDKASLMLWVRNLETAGNIDIHLVNAEWNEMDVTWNTRPAASYVKTVSVSEAGQYLIVDITPQARAWINDMNHGSGECRAGSAANFGVMITPSYSEPARVEFDTKMSGGIVPVLDVTLFDHSPGVPGAQGPAGPKGDRGDVGPAGAAGTKGDRGDVGPAGPAGAAGAAGVAGPKGDRGDVGPAGPAGIAGPAGVAGPAGIAGPAGVAGPVGAAGAKGDRGDVGPAGPAGIAGPAGEAGPKGDRGDVGPQGIAGAKGDRGDAGPAGPAGAAGVAGAAGIAGPAGEAGPKGDRGDVGPQGPAGPAGVTGGFGGVVVRTTVGLPGQPRVQSDCAPGEVAVSGGGSNTNTNKSLLSSYPAMGADSVPTAWIVETNGSGQDITTAFAICAR